MIRRTHDGPEIWRLPTGRIDIWRDRVSTSVRTRLERARSIVRPIAPVAASPPLADPGFEVSELNTPFSELEAISFHPEVGRQIAGPTRGPVDEQAPPEPHVPRGAERFGARRRGAPAPIYDVMPFAIELDLLEMRILELRDLVHRFVLVESGRCFGGFRKPQFLADHLARFARWRDQIVRVEVPDDVIAAALPGGHRVRGLSPGEHANRGALWRQVRASVDFPSDAVIMFSDLDEFPARGFVRWVRDFDVDLPVRTALPTLRYHAGWFDRDTRADIVVFSPKQFDRVDAEPDRIRDLPGPVFVVKGSGHYTSFLPPLLVRAKFALTGDWEPGIIPFLRNADGETAAMMAQGRWFGRQLDAYDPEIDRKALVPWAARAYRSRYPFFWGPFAGSPP